MGGVAHEDLGRPVVGRRLDRQLVERGGLVERDRDADAGLQSPERAAVVALGLPERARVAVDGLRERRRRSPARCRAADRTPRADAMATAAAGVGAAGSRRRALPAAAHENAGDDQRRGDEDDDERRHAANRVRSARRPAVERPRVCVSRAETVGNTAAVASAPLVSVGTTGGAGASRPAGEERGAERSGRRESLIRIAGERAQGDVLERLRDAGPNVPWSHRRLVEPSQRGRGFGVGRRTGRGRTAPRRARPRARTRRCGRRRGRPRPARARGTSRCRASCSSR